VNAISFAALVFGLAFAISMGVAGIIFLLFLGIQAARKRRAAAALADDDMPILRTGEGGVQA
jgi:threonine/homoserine/homoserine lactone efflux protein